jgi:hypothetical protein
MKNPMIYGILICLCLFKTGVDAGDMNGNATP